MHKWIENHVPNEKKPQWKEEANAWRLPYWDFAREADRPKSTLKYSPPTSDEAHDKLRLPIICMIPNVQVVFPKDDSLKSRPNPMYKYVNSKLMGQLPHPYTIKAEHVSGKGVEFPFDYPVSPLPHCRLEITETKLTIYVQWDKCKASTKYGILDSFDEEIWADGGQNWLRANYALNEHPWYSTPDGNKTSVPVLQDLVYRLFQQGLDNWGAFSSTRYNDDKKKKHMRMRKMQWT